MRNILLEIAAVDPATGLTTPIHMSSASADDSGIYLNGYTWVPAITAGPEFDFNIWSSGQPQTTTISYGQISFQMNPTFANTDIGKYALQGSLATVWFGSLNTPFASYRQIWTGTLGPFKRDNDQSGTISLLGPEANLARPLLTATYAGTGGVEGGANMIGTLKPRVFGACTNVEPVLIDPANWIYQVDGYASCAISNVYENAVDHGAPTATVTTYAALVSASLSTTAGQWASCPTLGLFRLGNAPNGKITADVGTSSTVGAIVTSLITVAGISSSFIDSTSMAAASRVSCLYVSDQTSISDVVGTVALENERYVIADSTGKFYLGSHASSKTAGVLNSNRKTAPLVIPNSVVKQPQTLPAWRVKVGHTHAWAVNSINEISPAVATIGANALAAQAAADAAQSTANSAVTSAATANTRLAAMANDNILDRTDKLQVIRDFQAISAELAGIQSQASGLSITTEATAYTNAYNTLNTYLSGLSPAYTDTTQDTAITATTFNTNFTNYYSARQTVLNAISAAAAVRAAWANVSGTPTPIAAVTNTTVIDNSNITVTAGGQLNTGVTTLTPVIDNSKVTVNGSGVIAGIGTAGVTVDNSKVTVNGSGQITNGVTTLTPIVDNSKITVPSTGILTGIGTAGVVIDNSKATVSTAGLFTNGAGGSTQLSLSGMGFNDSANLVIGANLNDPAIWQFGTGANNTVSSTILAGLGATSALNMGTTTSAITDAKLMKPFAVEAGATYLFTTRLFLAATFNGYIRGQIIPMNSAGSDLTSLLWVLDYRPGIVGGSGITADTYSTQTLNALMPATAVTARIEFDHGYYGASPTGNAVYALPRVQRQYSPGLVNLGDTVNLVTDPEFIDPVSWTSTGYPWQVLPNTTNGEGYGKNKVRITSTTAPAAGYTWYTSKPMPVEAGRSYQASCYTKTISGTSDVVRPIIQWFDATGANVGNNDIVYNDSGLTGRFSILVKAPTNAITAKFVILGGYQGTRVWEVSEPQFRVATMLGKNAVGSDGTTALTDANTITANGTAAFIAGQGLGATANNLAGLDSTANTKLSGIATGATVGAQAGTNLKDSGGTVLGDSAIKNLSITIDASGNLVNIGTSGVTVDNTKQLWTQVTGTGKPADGATVNRITTGTTAPASPVDGDIWVDTSVTPPVTRTRIASGWVASANLVTNTNQVTDGAGLGTTAAWGSVSSRPTNIASLTGTEGILNSGIAITSAGVLTGGGGGSVTITGLGYTGALNATVNVLTTSSTAPSSPNNGDVWCDTSVTPNLTKLRIGGAWVVSANYVTSTSHITDGAGLGTTATWGGVSGTGKPQDSADVTAANVPQLIAGASSLNFNADYTGALLAGQISQTVAYQRKVGSTDVSSTTTWVATPTSGITCSISSGGLLSFTAASNGTVTITAAYGGTTLASYLTVTKTLGAAPSGGGSGTTSASTYTFSSASSTSYTSAGSAELTVTCGSSGQIDLNLTLPFSAYGYTGYTGAYAKIQVKIVGGTYGDVATETYCVSQAYTPSGHVIDDFPSDGEIDITTSKTGLTNGSSYVFRVLWRTTSGSTIYADSGLFTAAQH